MSQGEEALKLVNDNRNRHGVPALIWDEDLCRQATGWAQHLAYEVKGLQHSTGEQRPNVSADWPVSLVSSAEHMNTDTAILEM